MLDWVVVLHEAGDVLSVVLCLVDIGQVVDVAWLGFEKPSAWSFPLRNHWRLREIVLDNRNEIGQIVAESDVQQIGVLCLGFDKVEDSVKALMRLQELRASNVVVAAYEGRLDSDSLWLRVKLQLSSSDAVVFTNRIDLWPRRKVNNSLQSIDIVKSRYGPDEFSLSSDDDSWALSEICLLDEGINGSRQLLSEGLCIGRQAADVCRKGKAASEHVQKHDICCICETIGVDRESHIIVKVHWPNTFDSVILRWCSRTI